jgi:hypothetical protein
MSRGVERDIELLALAGRGAAGPAARHPYVVASDRPPRGGRGLTRSGTGRGRERVWEREAGAW